MVCLPRFKAWDISPVLRLKFLSNLFKKFYGTSIRETKISSIVNGESIEIKNDNILIDVPVEEQYRLDDKKFQSQLHACNKKLYNYQINAIKKILELERRGYVEKHGYYLCQLVQGNL